MESGHAACLIPLLVTVLLNSVGRIATQQLQPTDARINNQNWNQQRNTNDLKQQERPQRPAVSSVVLAESPQCREDVARLCQEHERIDNFAALICLSDVERDRKDVSQECHDYLWNYKIQLTSDPRFDNPAFDVCKAAVTETECDKNTTQPGQLLSCLIGNQENIRQQDCLHFLSQMEAIIFRDFHLIYGFFDQCKSEIEKFQCARMNGEEMHCLQKNLDNLGFDCYHVVSNFTEAVSKNLHLDHVLMRSCSPALEKHCQVKDGDVSSRGCAMTSLKDLHFSFKFNEACKNDAQEHCRASKSKVEVIECLSEVVLNDTLVDQKYSISDKCQDQLNFELLQRGEDIKLDPTLKKSCNLDIQKFCANEPPYNAGQFECLRENQKSLSPECHPILFNREKQAAWMPNTDFLLINACKSVIQTFCAQVAPRQILTCLQRHLSDSDMDTQCRHVITQRAITQSLDYRLNPDLQMACKLDISTFCGKIIREFEEEDKENEKKKTIFYGNVTSCLRREWAKERLSDTCYSQMRLIMMRSMMDFRQDPALCAACKDEISSCRDEMDTVHGKVIECLKKKFLNGTLRSNNACRKEVMRVIEEGRGDVQLDPPLCRECAFALQKYCPHVPIGGSAQIVCLLESRRFLTPGCIALLDMREKLFNRIDAVAPSSFYDTDTSPQSEFQRGQGPSLIGISVLFILFWAICIAVLFWLRRRWQWSTKYSNLIRQNNSGDPERGRICLFTRRAATPVARPAEPTAS